MVEWITLVVSIIALIVTIIIEHEKIAQAFDKIRIWRKQQEYLREVHESVAKITPVRQEERPKASLKSLYRVMFIPLVLSSGLAGILEPKTYVIASLYGTIGLLPLFIIVLKNTMRDEENGLHAKWYEWAFFSIFYFLGIWALGWIWGVMTMALKLLTSGNLSIFWTGIISAITLPLVLLAANDSKGLKR